MERARVLTVAGSDPTGGAGLQADLAAFAAFRCHGMAVVAGLTVQDTHGVRSAHAVAAGFVAEQLDALFADCPPAAVKTGMLASVDAVSAVAAALAAHPGVCLVVDPVAASAGGVPLGDAAASAAVARLLVPVARLVTPNAPEAQALTGIRVTGIDGAVAAARRIVQLGARAALVKGGHVPGRSVADVLVESGRDEPLVMERPRIDTPRRIHGTGCALSAAIAAGLARGLDLREAAGVAGRWVHAAIERAHPVGGGALVPDFTVRVAGMPS